MRARLPTGLKERDPLRKRSELAVDLGLRNPLRDWDGVASRKVFEGTTAEQPLLTIVITVYKRHAFLCAAIASALSQDIGRPIEVIVVDDDPGSDKLAVVIDGLPALADANFRYFVNERNLGLFGNWNRGMMLARGEWISILNDDDLLDAACMTRLFEVVANDASIGGMIPAKRYLDDRADTARATGVAAPAQARRSVGSRILRVLTNRTSRRTLLGVAMGRVRTSWLFGFRRSRRLRPHIFFWGNVVGNPVGFVFKREEALGLGGFLAEEYPSSDHLFFARFAERCHFRQHRDVGATFRLASNESLKPDTIIAGMKQSLRLQRLMAGRQVPRWWLRLSPLVMAYHHGDGRRFLGADIPKTRVEDALGMKLPAERPLLLGFVRFVLRGY